MSFFSVSDLFEQSHTVNIKYNIYLDTLKSLLKLLSSRAGTVLGLSKYYYNTAKLLLLLDYVR